MTDFRTICIFICFNCNEFRESQFER